MKGLEYHGWKYRRGFGERFCSRILFVLAAGFLISGCSSQHDIWGRPMIIDASKRQTTEETIVATRGDVQSSQQTGSSDPYRMPPSGNPGAYARQDPYPLTGNPKRSGQRTAPAYPMGNQQQGKLAIPGQNSNPYSYTSREAPSLSQGLPSANPNVASVGGKQYGNYGRRQGPPGGIYPPTTTGTTHVPPSGVGPNPSRVVSPNSPASYGLSTTGQPEVSGVSVTEVRPSAAAKTKNTGAPNNIVYPGATTETTGVEPGTANDTFSSNTTPPAARIQVPNPSSGRGGLLQPAVAVHPAGYSPDRIGLMNAIAELEKYQSTNDSDLHTSLALHYLYLTQQQPEKANRFLPENEEQANRTLELLDYVRDKVAQRADFVISRVKFCSKVISFGNYKEIGLAELEDGKARTVFVYCELENFQSKRDAEGRFLSDLHIDITLYDSRYRVLCQKSVPVTDTPSYSIRHDFFLKGDLNIPDLTPGKHWLRVQVEDKIAGKWAKPKDIVFEVKPPGNTGESFPLPARK